MCSFPSTELELFQQGVDMGQDKRLEVIFSVPKAQSDKKQP